MQLIGSHPRYYYACGQNVRKGVTFCANKTRIREDVARPKLLAAIRDRLLSRDGVAHLRKTATKELANYTKKLEADLRERKDGLARTEHKLAGLADFIASGERSPYIAKTLGELETHANEERTAIVAMEQTLSAPIHLPSVDEIEAQVRKLDERLAQDPATAKEQLRCWLQGNAIRIGWQDGTVVAEGEVLPLVIVAENDEKKRPQLGARPNGSTLIYDQSRCVRWMLRWMMRASSRLLTAIVAARTHA
jgi:hypothetical protein